MLKKTTLAIALSSLFLGATAQAVTIYEEGGDKLSLYGEAGVGGHFNPHYEYGEFMEYPLLGNEEYGSDRHYIDDSFATMGIKGNYQQFYYRLELDYERRNYGGGDGKMGLAVDKLFIGYHITKNHAIEVGVTDTAYDDYDKYGDFTFNTTVETGEAGDQANTIKYEGTINQFKLGISYSYQAQSSSGAALGDVTNGYVGYFGDTISAVVGIEYRSGSAGESRFGDQMLYGFGARYEVTDALSLGINAYIEDEKIGKKAPAGSAPVTVYNNYQTLRNQGALISGRYKFSEKWEVTASYNFEEYEKWSIYNFENGGKKHSWGDTRTWGTVGVNFRPLSLVILAIEADAGESAQDLYAYGRVYF